MPKRLTTEQFIKRAVKKHNNNFSYSNTVYVDAITPVVVTCQYHGDFLTNPNNHIHHKSGCPRCYGRIKRTAMGFINQAQSVHGNRYDYSKVSYVNDNTKVEIICDTHGSFFPTPTNHIHRKSDCPDCALEEASLRNSMGRDAFIEKGTMVHGDRYDYSRVVYKNMRTKVNIGCSKHGYFNQEPGSHISGCGCPMCNSSKGEIRVRKWLQDHEIVFVEQHRFNDCRYKNPLIFDFYIPEQQTLIEFNGIQHYRRIPSFHRNAAIFEEGKLKDNIKKEYANKENFKLIVIPYNKSVDAILTKFLS